MLPMPASATREVLLAALDTYVHPLIGQGLVAAGCIVDLTPGATPHVVVELGFPAAGIAIDIVSDIKTLLRASCAVEATVRIGCRVLPQAVQKGLNPLPGVANIIAVASGKGGVGKSTTACNLALGLSAQGLRVGLLDADIYGPSVPKLLGLSGKPRVLEGKTLEPMQAYGLKAMSIGFLIEPESAMIWRGPMVQSAITQMLRDVAWGELDVLVVDMPPGTGDAQLTMAQATPLSGAVIVSTPQDLALIDARRGVTMFRKVSVPILGVIENMATFICPNCGAASAIFGHGGARHEAERLEVPFLGEIPLTMAIRETSDAGRPVVATDPDGPQAKVYREIAQKLWGNLTGAPAGRAAPRIVIE